MTFSSTSIVKIVAHLCEPIHFLNVTHFLFIVLQKPRVLLGLWSRQELLLGYTEELRRSLVDYGLDAIVADEHLKCL